MLPLSILWHPLAFIIIIYWFLTWSFLVLAIIRCSILISAIIYATFPPLSFRKRTKNDPRRPGPFCGTFQLRLTRHLRLRHGNEKEVSDALGFPMSRRNEAFAIIRKNGMNKHNVEMMKSTEYELLREREPGKPKDLMVCGTCRGCYDRAYMWHHKRHCQASEDTVSPPSIPVSLMRTSDDKVNIADFADHDANDEVDSDVNDNDSDGENEPALPEEWTSELINPPDFPFVDAANVGVNNVEQCRAMTAEQQFGLFNTDYFLAL